MKKQNKSSGLAAGLTIGVAAIAALGAAFLYGTKEGAVKRQKIKGWALKMKGEILEELEHANSLSQEAYHSIVDAAGKRYASVKNIDPKELEKTVATLKKHFTSVVKKVKQTKKPGKSNGGK